MTEEEFKIILENKKNDDSVFLNTYIEQLPEEIRLKYIDYYDFNAWGSYKRILSGISNEEIAFEIMKVACFKEPNEYNIYNLFQHVPQKYKESFFQTIREREEQLGNNIITPYNISDYLLEFNIKDRSRIFKEIIFKDFWDSRKPNQEGSRFGNFDYYKVLEAFKGELVPLEDSSMFDILKFLARELNKVNSKNIRKDVTLNSIGNVVGIFYDEHYDAREVLKFLINNRYVNNTSFYNLVDYLPASIKKDIIFTVIDGMKKVNDNIGTYTFYSMINTLNQAEISEAINKYVINDKLFSYSYPCSNLDSSRIDYMFFINTIFSLMPKEELDSNFGMLHSKIISNSRMPKYDVRYEYIIKVYSEKFNVNYDNLTRFIKRFGFSTLKFMDNSNIIKCLNMSQDNFDKLLSLFDDSNLYFDKSIRNDVVNSLLQRQFRITNPEIYNIFNAFEMCVFNKNEDGVRELLDAIQSRIRIDEYLVKNNVDYEQFIKQIMKGKLGVLHQITDRYIAFEREQYVRMRIKNIDEVLLLDKVITRESYKKDYIENRPYAIYSRLGGLDRSLFTTNQLKLIDDYDLFHSILAVKQAPKNFQLTPEIRVYLKEFSGLLDIMYDNKIDFDFYNPDNSQNKTLSYKYVQKDINPEFLLGILAETNFNGLMNTINNPDLLTKLNNFFSKYKMVGWGETFNPLIKECDLVFEEGTLAGLIGNFDKIVDKVDSKASLTSVIDYGNCYSSLSNFYSLLFGREDYNLIASNFGKNKASMSKYNRLKGTLELVKDMYTRSEVTTPPINQTFTLSNGKKIGVVLGNSTNMMNLTYGERTEACLRMGGAFDDLYHYCIQDKNGFHIRFVDSETVEFVSRVSGFRNGNTLFLNELRDSVSSNYNNEELYEVMKQVSKYLVSESNDSDVPIDNVLITSDYALQEHVSECRKLEISDRKKAFRDLNFNMMDKAIVLATSTSDNSIVPYDFRDDVPVYDTVRDQIRIYHGNDAIYRIEQLRIINDLLNGILPEDINTEYSVKEYDYVVSGEDFYVGFKNNKSDVFVLDKSKDDMRTKMEIAEVLKKRNNSKSSKGGVRK